MGKLHLTYDKIIIGLSIKSLIYSFLERIPILYINSDSNKSPKEFEFFNNEVTFENIFVNYSPNIFKDCFGNAVVFGHRKKDVYEKLLFLMSMEGFLPFSNKITNIKYLGDGNLKIKTDFNKIITIKTNNILVFDEIGIENIDVFKKKSLLKERHSIFSIKKMNSKTYNFVRFSHEKPLKYMFLFRNRAIAVSEENVDFDEIKFFIREYLENQDNKEIEILFKETYLIEDNYVSLKSDNNIEFINKSEQEIVEECLRTHPDVYKNFLHRYCNILFCSKDIIITKKEHYRRLKKIKSELKANV